MSSARTPPTTRRRGAGHATAKNTSRLMAVSSKKSAESANNAADPIEAATMNSTKKYARLSSATMSTTRLIRSAAMASDGTPEPRRSGA